VSSLSAWCAHTRPRVGSAQPVRISEALGAILILKAFAAGCSALTGIEAIAIGVPAFRALLGAMLIGLSVLIRREHVPPGSVTVLAQLTAGSFGTGPGLLRDEQRRHRGPGAGRQHQLRRAASAD
jgi:hypothetical protein